MWYRWGYLLYRACRCGLRISTLRVSNWSENSYTVDNCTEFRALKQLDKKIGIGFLILQEISKALRGLILLQVVCDLEYYL
jgi:hypothetical protein